MKAASSDKCEIAQIEVSTHNNLNDETQFIARKFCA